jgi:HD-GYP domain-containing protein (c-di-GMP phosphodiesterase class II)
MPKELPAAPIEEAVLEGLPESVFGNDEWALVMTRGLVRRLLDCADSGQFSDFTKAIRVAAHGPKIQDVRTIVDGVCDAAVTQAIVAGRSSDRFFTAVSQMRSAAHEVLDYRSEREPQAATPSATIDACETLLHFVSASRPELRKHLDAVSALSVRIGRQLDMTPDVLEALRLGALLHDIGQLTTGTDPALSERDPGHAIVAERTLGAIEPLRHLASAVRAHHEHFDGSGAPDHLRGAEIPVEARIIAVADAFEHLANRPGRTNPVAAAVSELWQDAGSAYDPDVVAAVTRLFNQHWRVRRTASGAP